ncbi:MAG: hypothetical protein J1F11_01790 [Oscillospiraceae bacterium]|nr:hypothetical protein [Oscillospiraceae bacterium]
MKLRKLIAGVAAAAVAVSAMAVNAFAATFEGSTKITDKSYWTQYPIVSKDDGRGLDQLIGDLDPAAVSSITFKSDSPDMIVGYNGSDGAWHQTDKAKEVTLKIADILIEADADHDPYIAAIISSGDGVEHTITWTAEAEDAAADTEAEGDADAEAADADAAADEGDADAAEADDDAADVAEVEDEDEDVDVEEDADEAEAPTPAPAAAASGDGVIGNDGNYFDGGTLFLVADDGKAQFAVDNGIDITSIYGVRFNVELDDAEVADDSVWLGGGIGANSKSTGWLQNDWTRGDKLDTSTGTITWQNDAPIFAADDPYAQLWIQVWGGSVSAVSVEMLDANGNVITAGSSSAATTTTTTGTTTAPKSGNVAVASIASVMALAGAAAVVSRKRK